MLIKHTFKMTYRELLENETKQLTKLRLPDAQTDAWLLFEAITGMNLATYLVCQEEEAPEEVVAAYEGYIESRLQGKPVQLIIGETEFMGFKFKVDGGELIPRQDTEILVEKVLEFKKKYDSITGAATLEQATKPATLRVLDLFTGTGCIAISLALLGNFEKVCAGDISEAAYKNAKLNADNNGAAIDLRLGDMFEPFAREVFDIITANPPYIRSAEIKNLMPEVRDYDPKIALDGGADGLMFYRRLAVAARPHLTHGGAIFMEIGYDQAADVSNIFTDMGYKNIKVIKDYSGNDRVVIARK